MSGKNNQSENISNNMNMDIRHFLLNLECGYDFKIYREINIVYKTDKKGKKYKVPQGEKNNLTIAELKNATRGYGNSFSLYTKHIPNMYVVDFDTKENLEGCELYNYLLKSKTPYTETTKGFHFYTYITNLAQFSNEKKIYKDKTYEIDLIGKINNIWETKDRVVINGSEPIVSVDWNDFKKFWDIEFMNFGGNKPKPKPKKKVKVVNTPSPPVSPLTSDNESVEEEIMEIIIDINDPQVVEIKNLLSRITSKLENYNEWIKVVFAVHNELGGNETAYNLIHDWSKTSSHYDSETFEEYFKPKWKYLDKEKRTDDTKLSKGSLIYWAELEDPSNPFDKAFHKDCAWIEVEEKGKTIKKCVDKNNHNEIGRPNINALVEEMNKELIFIKETGEFVILDKNSDGEDIWFLKKETNAKTHYKCFTFKNRTDIPVGDKNVNPYMIWISNLNRRSVTKIGFNPKDINDPDIFNIWKGFRITKEIANNYEEDQAAPILEHIKKRWCQNKQETYDYVLNYFAHIIQKPYKKSGVVLTLKSDEGGGKGIIFEKLGEIIGSNHYVQINNIDQLTGNFNGIGEGKVLCNLDEAFWGGDKKKEGIVKNIITENKINVNKKNKEAYTIDDYCNYCITSNNEWMIGVSEGSRRYYALELDNELSGRSSQEKMEIIQPILDAPAEAFAKILYNRDISNYNPRIFDKTELLQEQIEQGWQPIKKWWFNVLTEGGFTGKKLRKGFSEFNKLPKVIKNEGRDNESIERLGLKKETYYKNEEGKYIDSSGNICSSYNKRVKDKFYCLEKDFLYENYLENTQAQHKSSANHFYKDLGKFCLDNLLVEKKLNSEDGRRSRYIILPPLEKAQEKFNQLQQYNYNYECDNCDDISFD